MYIYVYIVQFLMLLYLNIFTQTHDAYGSGSR